MYFALVVLCTTSYGLISQVFMDKNTIDLSLLNTMVATYMSFYFVHTR